MRFPSPLFVGDTVRVETEVIAKRESRSRPTNGILTLEHRGYNQHDALIASCRRAVLMLRAPAAAPRERQAEGLQKERAPQAGLVLEQSTSCPNG